MPTLSTIRDAGEADIEALLKQLDERHKAMLRDAIKQYGVQYIPDSIWKEIQFNTEQQTTAAILLLLILADDATSEAMAAQGVARTPLSNEQLARYSLSAAQQAHDTASGTTATIRNRLVRQVQDHALKGRGGLGLVTDDGIDTALDDVFTKSRRETISIDTSTQAMSAGQRAAAQRGDGAAVDSAKTTIALIWRTERDNLVCPRCSPLEGTTEDVWGRVFPEGPGPACHPNCRCELEVKVVFAPPEPIE